MKKRILAAALLVGGLTLTAGPVAQAAPQLAPSAAAEAQALVCTVNDNGVNFRGGPGTHHPVLGQVNRGQQFAARNYDGRWIMGDIVGGRTGVWIHDAYLDC
ncbi:SH3 domain-containing protein [Streptomyces sp. NPDC058653]|uniref:SH3 domain-containing protein n=1 Tax=Streptomyces sp. NPDC058653 TaxID=3346576 RepID=UPI0036494F74